MPQDIRKPSHMIELRMRGNHIVNRPNPAVPKIRRDDAPAHVEPLVTGATVDQDHFTVRQFEHRAIALRHVEKRNAETVAIEQEPRRPHPPAEQQEE